MRNMAPAQAAPGPFAVVAKTGHGVPAAPGFNGQKQNRHAAALGQAAAWRRASARLGGPPKMKRRGPPPHT
jgi:hypothetical protein